MMTPGWHYQISEIGSSDSSAISFGNVQGLNRNGRYHWYEATSMQSNARLSNHNRDRVHRNVLRTNTHARAGDPVTRPDRGHRAERPGSPTVA
jgi:hypothetical protein